MQDRLCVVVAFCEEERARLIKIMEDLGFRSVGVRNGGQLCAHRREPPEVLVVVDDQRPIIRDNRQLLAADGRLLEVARGWPLLSKPITLELQVGADEESIRVSLLEQRQARAEFARYRAELATERRAALVPVMEDLEPLPERVPILQAAE